MAATWIKPIHVNKGKSIARTITDSTDYAGNPEKSEKGTLVMGFACDPRTADAEFLLSKREYDYLTGRDQGKHNILAYHIRVSFKPGEITPEEALAVGLSDNCCAVAQQNADATRPCCCKYFPEH